MEELIKNIEKSKMFRFDELVDYEDGQVSSLTLAQKPGVGITVMSFSKNESISTHSAPGDALVYVLDGQGEFTIDGVPHILCAGESIVMPYSIPHSVRAVTNFKMLLIVVK